MPLISLTCPKCSHVATVNSDVIYPVCPLCGTPFSLDNVQLPGDLVVLESYDSLEQYLSSGFRFLYFKAYDLLEDWSKKAKDEYKNDFWYMVLDLIGKIKIDVIFLLPEPNFVLSKVQMEYDAKTRIYHYARKKYASIELNEYEKLLSFYPDQASEQQRKWKKAPSHYDELKVENDEYVKKCEIIKNEYMDRLKEAASNDDQKAVVDNIQVWMHKVQHASIELDRYNQNITNFVLEDYEKTPNPGNKGKYSLYMILYVLSFFVFVTSIVDLAVSIYRQSGLTGPLSYLVSAFSSLLITGGMIFYIASTRLLKKHPIIAIAMIIVDLLVCASGILTSELQAIVKWFTIFSMSISLIFLFWFTIRVVKYTPRRTNKKHTIIGNFEALTTDNFLVNYSFDWLEYSGGNINPVYYKEDWSKQ